MLDIVSETVGNLNFF